MDRFTAAKLKIERANKHISDLNAITLALPDTYASMIERHDSIRFQQITYTPPDAKIATDMAVIIGDAIHNLRVAVEYAYLGAVEKHAPSVLDMHTKFPTGYTRKDVENGLTGRKIDSS